MQTLPIIPDCNVFEDCCASRGSALEYGITELGFHASEEAFNNRIIPAIALATHALNHAVRGEKFRKVFACVLTTTVGVKYRSGLGPAVRYGRTQGRDDEFSFHRCVHRPTDYATRNEIKHDRKIQPAFARWDVWVSSPRESHPRALAEPDVNLSAHPAPIIEPPT